MTKTYAESIATRVSGEPEKRAELSDRLGDAREALQEAMQDHSEALTCDLEGWPKEHDQAQLCRAYEAARKDYQTALAAVTAFLEGEG